MKFPSFKANTKLADHEQQYKTFITEHNVSQNTNTFSDFFHRQHNLKNHVSEETSPKTLLFFKLC
jgi:hypothetical protein